MRIIDMMAQVGQFISLEFFPPKDPAAWPDFFKAVERLRELKPLFVSVTYGAGGGAQANTLEIVRRLKRDHLLEPMAHLTCVGANENALLEFVQQLREAGIHNVLALRGDPPRDQENFRWEGLPFRHACDLVKLLRSRHPDLGLAVAGYPETHPEAANSEEDLLNLRGKLDQGGDFVITQLFLDNRHYFRFVERLRKLGVDKPVIPGIMPVLSLQSIQRMSSMCGASIPQDFQAALERADRQGGSEAVAWLGVDHARRQVRELLEAGVPGVHLYTLNRAEACLSLVNDPEISARLLLD